LVPDRLAALRRLLQGRGLDAYIVPSADQHASEYVPRAWERRAWICGFTGSAGDAVVTAAEALLWTDARYFLRAEQELAGTGFRLMQGGVPGKPSMQEWLGSQLRPGQRLGFDPRLLSHERAGDLERDLGARGIVLVSVPDNLIDLLWVDRPSLPSGKARAWEARYAGQTAGTKLERLRAKMAEMRVDTHAITRLDDIAWLYNLRGSDVDYNPLLIAYALVTRDEALLYVHEGKVSTGALGPQVVLRDYNAFGDALEERARAGARFWIDPATASRWVVERASGGRAPYLGPGPIPSFKAVKGDTEIEGMRRAHVRDGVALVRFLSWLEQSVPRGGVTEIAVATELDRFRAMGEHYQGPSFGPIVGYGEHGAIVHYEATPESASTLAARGLLLVDSGGQYLDGTTDVTRTVALGPPTPEQRTRFTLVLKGHIQMALVPFPVGTSGGQLDVLARRALWEVGLNYGHGTGHGVGAYLCVHEGPHSISPNARNVALEPGMVVSNEPGYYETGAYGIRTENLVYVVKDPEREGFLRFQNLTLCPIDLTLVDAGLLSPQERAYLDSYHATVREALSPHVVGPQRQWLERATQPVPG
jgi:Xaa-Pro aminopeptidase